MTSTALSLSLSLFAIFSFFQADVGLGVVSMVRPGTAAAPGLQVAISGKRKLLAVDLTGSDPALAAVGKRTRAVGMEDSDDDEDDEDFGHSGGRGE